MSAADLFTLAAETPNTPMHVGALAVLDAGGRLRPAEVRAAIGGAVAGIPQLRQVIHRSAGRRGWVGDPAFHIDRHVTHVEVAPPGDEEALLRLTERLLAPPLDRARPLWHVWVVTGLTEGRVALLVAFHHAVADGLAAVDLFTALLGGERPAPRDPAAPAPRRGPADLVRAGRTMFSRVSRTSLNRPAGPRRRLAVLRFDLAEARHVAHRHGGKVNDVLLCVIAGGVRALLTARGEEPATAHVRASVAVSLRSGPTTRLGNQVGSLLVRLPVDEPDPAARLRTVAARTRATKRGHLAGASVVAQSLLVRLGLVRRVITRQRMISFIESDLTGPPAPIRLLGVPVLDLVPFTALAGNLTVAFVAMSYAGRLTLTVDADADAVPDLPVLVAAVTRDWTTLAGTTAG